MTVDGGVVKHAHVLQPFALQKAQRQPKWNVNFMGTHCSLCLQSFENDEKCCLSAVSSCRVVMWPRSWSNLNWAYLGQWRINLYSIAHCLRGFKYLPWCYKFETFCGDSIRSRKGWKIFKIWTGSSILELPYSTR